MDLYFFLLSILTFEVRTKIITLINLSNGQLFLEKSKLSSPTGHQPIILNMVLLFISAFAQLIIDWEYNGIHVVFLAWKIFLVSVDLLRVEKVCFVEFGSSL